MANILRTTKINDLLFSLIRWDTYPPLILFWQLPGLFVLTQRGLKLC